MADRSYPQDITNPWVRQVQHHLPPVLEVATWRRILSPALWWVALIRTTPGRTASGTMTSGGEAATSSRCPSSTRLTGSGPGLTSAPMMSAGPGWVIAARRVTATSTERRRGGFSRATGRWALRSQPCGGRTRVEARRARPRRGSSRAGRYWLRNEKGHRYVIYPDDAEPYAAHAERTVALRTPPPPQVLPYLE